MRLRSFLTIACVAAAAFCAVSCNKDIIPAAAVSGDAIEVSAYNGMMTKAPVNGTVMPTSRTIIFSAYYNAVEGSSANYFTASVFTKKSGDNTLWVSNPARYWPLNGTLDFLGYTLDNNSRVSAVTWGTNVTSSVTMTLANNATNQDDLLVGGASAQTKESHAVVFKHAEALLAFQARSSVAYNASTNYGITITDIKVNDTYHSGTVACTRTGGNIAFAWSALGNKQNLTLPSMTSTNLTSAYANIAGSPGMILPSQAMTTVTMYYTLHNGKDGSGNPINNTLQYTFNAGSGTWEPGKKYTYQIDITLTAIEVNATVTDWNAQTPQEIDIPSA